MISVAPGFTLARTKVSIDLAELSAIADRPPRPERVSRYFASLRLGLGLPALRLITSTAPTTRILPAALGSKKASPARKGISRLVHLDDAFEKIAVGIDHRAPKLLRQQPGRLVGDPASWSSNCRADMPLECVDITCAAQNHVVGGNSDRCIAVPAVSEVCRPQSRHSNSRGRLFKATRVFFRTRDKRTRPARVVKKGKQRSTAHREILSRPPASVRPRPTAWRSESRAPQARPPSETTYSGPSLTG